MEDFSLCPGLSLSFPLSLAYPPILGLLGYFLNTEEGLPILLQRSLWSASELFLCCVFMFIPRLCCWDANSPTWVLFYFASCVAGIWLVPCAAQDETWSPV